MNNKEEKAGKHGGRHPLVPRLRFPDFREADSWKEYLLKDLEQQNWLELGRGNVVSNKDIAKSPGNYPIYSSSVKNDGYMGSYSEFMFDEELITWSIDGGGNFFYREKHKFSVTNVSGYIRIKKRYITYRFLAYELQHLHSLMRFDYQIKAHPSVIRDVYRLAIPCPEEQQKIADCLSSLDDLITLESQKLNALKTHKKGLMQQLFPAGGETVPRLRFPEFREAGEWIKTKICDAVIYESSTLAQGKLQITSGGYPVFGADGIVGYIGFFDQKEDYIAIVKDGSGAGRLTFTKGRSSILSTLGCLRPKSIARTETLWLFYCLLSLNLKNHIKGSGIPHLYFSDYGKEEIGVPAPGEQQKIADCLSSLDDLITAQAQKVEVLKKHKKGLMQQLFPVLDDAIG